MMIDALKQELEFLAVVYVKPGQRHRNKLDCEFDRIADAVGWIYDAHPQRLGADIIRKYEEDGHTKHDIVWSG